METRRTKVTGRESVTSCPGKQPDRSAWWKPPRNSIALPSCQLPEPTVSDKAGALLCLLVLGAQRQEESRPVASPWLFWVDKIDSVPPCT